jgi:membrane fusion protein (multidrug efflux system)
MPLQTQNSHNGQIADAEPPAEQERLDRSDSPAASDGPTQQGSIAPGDSVKYRRGILLTVLLVAVVVGCALWWLHARTYESTDDAQVDGNLNPIAARVEGTIKAVYVADNQTVRAGQPILDLDTRDAQVSLDQAQADFDQAVAQLHSEVPNLVMQRASNRSDLATATLGIVDDQAAVDAAGHDYDADLAKLAQAQAANQRAQGDLFRYRKLLDKQELAQSDYDQYFSTAQSDAASVDAAAATVASQRKLIEQRAAELKEQQAKTRQTVDNAPQEIRIKHANDGMRAASVESYAAKLEQAKLDLAYCHVIAPVSGIVLQRSAEIGGRISAGQQLLMIAQVDDPWVIANFKETQVRKMRPGQRVDIHVDALSRTLTGWVEDMPGATGDRASALPAENATGNYVKVVQRLPVRIRLRSGQMGLNQLTPGMSVEPKVYIR